MDALLQFAGPILGGFVASWYGAKLAFRRTVRERALTDRVGWFQDVIRSCSDYEEVLGRLQSNYLHAAVIKPAKARAGRAGSAVEPAQHTPERFRPMPDRWQEVVKSEATFRRALQLCDVHTSGKLRSMCRVTLSYTATIAAGQWVDLGPAPELFGADILGRKIQLTGLRDGLQAELRRILQYDGWLRSTFPSINKWFVLRELDRERKRLERAAAETGRST